MKKNKQKTSKISRFIAKNPRFATCLYFALVLLLGAALLYYYLPLLLNYGPNTINTEFDLAVSGGISYSAQFILLYFAILLVGIPYLLWQTKDFKNINTLKEKSKNDSEAKKKYDKIISKCVSLPLQVFLIISFLPTIALSIAFWFLGFTSFADAKIIFITFTISLLVASLIITIFKNLFKTVLTSLNNTKHLKRSRISLLYTLIIQISSLIILCTLYTFLLLYSNNLEEKSNVLKEYYTYEVNAIVEKTNPNTIQELIPELERMTMFSNEDSIFLIDSINTFVDYDSNIIIDENNNFIVPNEYKSTASDFFIRYALEVTNDEDYLVYDYYGTEYQGVIIPIKINDSEIRVVIRYDLSSGNLVSIFTNIAIIMIYCGISIYFISHSITKEITLVTKSMNNISSNNAKVGLNEKLPVTSNDEIGELLVAFNDIQSLTKQNINQIENSQAILLERERLASLGQMIGGIAHNMKTPIMSISGAAEGLTELVGEYIASISNPTVTTEDHKEIAKDMIEWITKIKTHTSYMSDIITTVKGQASQLSTTDYGVFTLYDLSKKVDILVKHEIKKALLTLEISIACDPAQTLHGDINSLIQVIVNLISNSIQSYEGKPNEKIQFSIDSDSENVYIQIKDSGCGMSDEIKAKLFKEMVTTKGKNGTGLGLYMSYSTIRGNFGGSISFTSEQDVGTTFLITLPIKFK